MYRASLESLLLASALLLSGAPSASAQDASPTRESRPRAAERLRPVGPVTVTATSVDWAKNGMMIYTGDVKLASDTLNLDGDRLELEQLGDGEYRARIIGKPAHLLHSGTPASGETPADPPVTARGRTLVFDSKNGIADISGDARVTRGEDEITGETIHYNVNERRIQAAGGSGGQVRIVIQPNNRAAPASGTP